MANVRFTEYLPEYGLEAVKMCRRSFQRALGIEEHSRWEELEGHLSYFRGLDPGTITVALDTKSSAVVGVMTLRDEELHHLFVHVDYQGRGIGSEFLSRAKSIKPLGFYLYTFQRNTGAQQFYLAHGFREVGCGYADFEDNPWASSKEDLADIRYHWAPK